MANEPYRQTNFPFEIVYATASQWATSGDYILQRYQLGVESNTGNAKLGDGTSTWDQLYYWPPNASFDNNTAVRAATTANITIATALNNGDTLDGVTLATGDLVLVKNQSAPETNGIYVVGVVPVRAPAYDAYNEYPGAIVSVTEGTANGNTLWLCTSNRGGTLGTTAIDFSAFGTPETTASLGALINGASAATLADADLVPVVQGSVTLKTTFTAIKAFLATWLGFTAASASGPTSLAFKEDTDNGVHAVTLKAPAAVTANVDVTLPDAAGTLALESLQTAVLQADFPKTNDTLTAVTGWSNTITLEAGKTYRVTGQFVWTCLSVSGNVDFGGGSVTATGLSGIESATSLADSTVTTANILGLTAALNSGADSGAIMVFDFTIQVNAGGTLIPRFAQYTTDAAASTLNKYSTISAQEVNPTPSY